MKAVTLKPGHVRPVWSGHPWVFAQAIERIEGGAGPGDEVTVRDPQGAVLGRGFYTPRSAIPVRLYTHADLPVDAALIRRRIEQAFAVRRDLGLPNTQTHHETDGYRLIHAEGDGLPGLVVDIFRDVAVVQLNTVGIKMREGVIFDALQSLIPLRAIIDRTSAATAKREGFEAASGIVRGDSSIEYLEFSERGIQYRIPMSLTQKTGFYFDQRILRARAEQLAHGKRVLDLYSFVGSFAMAAARGGATEVVAIDDSPIAVEVGAECARLNSLHTRITSVRSDAKKALSHASHHGGYDLVICDPPKLAPSKTSKDGALPAYKSLAGAAARAVKPGGILIFCSCSAAISIENLTRALALGAREARMHAVVFDRQYQGGDHPVPAAFPEGLYLKSVIARLYPIG